MFSYMDPSITLYVLIRFSSSFFVVVSISPAYNITKKRHYWKNWYVGSCSAFPWANLLLWEMPSNRIIIIHYLSKVNILFHLLNHFITSHHLYRDTASKCTNLVFMQLILRSTDINFIFPYWYIVHSIFAILLIMFCNNTKTTLTIHKSLYFWILNRNFILKFLILFFFSSSWHKVHENQNKLYMQNRIFLNLINVSVQLIIW